LAQFGDPFFDQTADESQLAMNHNPGYWKFLVLAHMLAAKHKDLPFTHLQHGRYVLYGKHFAHNGQLLSLLRFLVHDISGQLRAQNLANDSVLDQLRERCLEKIADHEAQAILNTLLGGRGLLFYDTKDSLTEARLVRAWVG
jgi:hypothetical protein